MAVGEFDVDTVPDVDNVVVHVMETVVVTVADMVAVNDNVGEPLYVER